MKTIILFLTIVMLSHLPVAAQEMDDLIAMSLDELLNIEVVSASKYEQNLQESPSAISIITQQDIKYAPAHTVPELLQYVVGMDGYTKTYTDMDVAARGFAYDETSKMLVLIDGQAVNVVPYGGMQWPTLPLTLEEIDKIEIVRGSASSIYGADALVGVVNIITRKANERKNMASLLYGERGTGQYQVHLRKSFDNNWSVAVSGGFTQTEKKGDVETSAAKMVAPNYELKDWAKIFMGTFRADYEGKGLAFSSFGGYSSDDEGYNPSPGDNSIDKSEKQTLFINNSLVKSIGADRAVLKLGYRTLSQENQRWADDAYTFKYKIKKGDGVDLDAQYILKRYNNNTLIGGVNFSYLQASRDIANTPPYIYDENDKLFSVYAQQEIRLINRKLALTLGGRFDKWDSLDGVFSPKAAMNLSLLKSRVNLRLSAGSSFRRPAFDENFYFVSWPGGWFKGAAIEAITEDGELVEGELLKPEKLTAYEIGIRVTPFNSMLIGIETFYHDVKDNIGYTVYESDAGNLNLGFENTRDKLHISGVEVEAKKYITSMFSTFLNYTYQKAEIDVTGSGKEDWENAPNNKISGGVRYLGPVNLDLRFRYVSDLAYQEISSITVDDYWTVDFALSKDFSNGIFAKLGVLNMTDNAHYEYPMYTTIKRKALLTVQYSF